MFYILHLLSPPPPPNVSSLLLPLSSLFLSFPSHSSHKLFLLHPSLHPLSLPLYQPYLSTICHFNLTSIPLPLTPSFIPPFLSPSHSLLHLFLSLSLSLPPPSLPLLLTPSFPSLLPFIFLPLFLSPSSLFTPPAPSLPPSRTHSALRSTQHLTDVMPWV